MSFFIYFGQFEIKLVHLPDVVAVVVVVVALKLSIARHFRLGIDLKLN